MDMHALLPQERPRLRPCCKYNKKPWMEGTLDTTYRGDFIGKEVPHERATGRASGMNLFGPTFDGTTTMNSDFKVWEVKREGPIRPTNTNMGNDLPFNGASTYKGDFGPKEAPYHLVKPKNKYQPNNAPLESETTHRRDFTQREVVPPPKTIVRGTNIPTSAGPFAGQSLYKDTYGKQPYAKREALIQNGSSDIMPHGAFDDKTMYTTSYVQKELARQDAVRPTDARPQTPQGWYGGAPSTEYRGQYLTKEGAAAEPIRVTRSMGVLPTGKFDGTTNNRTDYVPFEVPGTKMIRPSPAFDQEKLPFNGQSTYASAFNPKDVPYSRVRPKNAYEPNSAPFDGTTTQRSAYVPMEVRPNQRVGARQGNIATSAGPFEGQSTYKGDFTKMPGTKRDKIVPPETDKNSGPFNGQTTYGKDYDLKEIPAQYRRKRDDECESCVDGVPGVTCIDL